MGREPCSGFEETVADRLEAIMPAEGITPGARECHDAQPGRHRVDWIYPEAQPRPFALEVTSIVAPVDTKATKPAKRLGQELSELAEAEGLGAWLVAVDTGRDFRTLMSEIATILRAWRPKRQELLESDGQIRPGSYTLDGVPRSHWAAYIAEHERVKELGIVELKPIRSERENIVYVLPGRTEMIESFGPELLEALESKREVLALVPDVERHLGILVERWDRSNEPEDTPVPDIPAEIDVLWIVHAWRQGFEAYPVWVARRGESSWRVYASESR